MLDLGDRFFALNCNIEARSKSTRLNPHHFSFTSKFDRAHNCSSCESHHEGHWTVWRNWRSGLKKKSPETYVSTHGVQFESHVARLKLHVHRVLQIKATIFPFLWIGLSRGIVGLVHDFDACFDRST